ncbi:MAG: polymer-forming cytoskeletal protein [Verrucomicrobia bacterium]|nr:polymer-forming cytoskeletal protein [Verrucomicrobiota bacterium]
MFKRRSPYEESQSPLMQEEKGYLNRPVSNYTPPQESIPPRVYEGQDGRSPYRSPAQAYPRHKEEAQEALNDDVMAQEVWRPLGYPPRAPGAVDMEEPETVLGQGISIKGHLQFQRFLRVDGEFEGELESQGRIVVGPTGFVRANIEMREAIIEGRVEGNLKISGRLELRGEAKVFGNIEARVMMVDEGVTMVGQVTVRPKEE